MQVLWRMREGPRSACVPPLGALLTATASTGCQNCCSPRLPYPPLSAETRPDLCNTISPSLPFSSLPSRPQTQMGRTFAGDAFLPSPALVEFRDFEVGRTVTAAVQVINRSYRKNTFRWGNQPHRWVWGEA